MLNIENLGFGYGRKRLFNNMNLQLQKGKIYGLLGLNGAGKTSLLKLMCGLLFPNEGQISLMGHNPSKREADFLSKIFMLPEEPSISNVSHNEFLKCIAPFYSGFDKEYFNHCLAKLELPSEFRVGKFSFGQKKKLLHAFAFSCGATYLILDEPTNGLDIPSKVAFRQLVVDSTQSDSTVIISTHQVRDIESLIDNVIILDKGKIILNESLSHLLDKVCMRKDSVEPDASSASMLYVEKIAGEFYSFLEKDSSANSTSIDFELLFNAIVSEPERFARLMKEHAV